MPSMFFVFDELTNVLCLSRHLNQVYRFYVNEVKVRVRSMRRTYIILRLLRGPKLCCRTKKHERIFNLGYIGSCEDQRSSGVRRNEHWKRILVGSYVDLVERLEGLCRRDQCSPMGVKRVACRETSVE